MLQRSAARDLCTSDLVQPGGKGECLQPGQRMRELIDGIVGAWLRAMTASIGRLELKGDIDLFARIHRCRPRAVGREVDATAVRVETVLGVDELAGMRHD